MFVTDQIPDSGMGCFLSKHSWGGFNKHVYKQQKGLRPLHLNKLSGTSSFQCYNEAFTYLRRAVSKGHTKQPLNTEECGESVWEVVSLRGSEQSWSR